MTSQAFPQIETLRLILKKPEIEDWPTVSFLRSNPKVNRYVKRPSAKTRSKAQDFINRISIDMSNGSILMWFIFNKAKNEMVGTICLWNFSKDRKTAELGYDLKPDFQGQGMMSESLQAVVLYGFKTLFLEKIEAFTSYENQSSVKLLEINNFVLNESRFDLSNPDNIIFEYLRNNQK